MQVDPSYRGGGGVQGNGDHFRLSQYRDADNLIARFRCLTSQLQVAFRLPPPRVDLYSPEYTLEMQRRDDLKAMFQHYGGGMRVIPPLPVIYMGY